MTDRSEGQGKQIFRLVAAAAILGLGAFAYRMLFDYDPSTTRRGLEGSDAAFFSPTGNNPFFVYTIAAWISFRRREFFFRASRSKTSLAIGGILVASAAALSAWAYHVQAPDLLIGSLALASLGLHTWLAGHEGFRAALLPSLVLLALIPLPAVFVNSLVYKLQITTATLSVEILNAIGFEAAQAADMFTVGGRIFQVIESCSGMRSTQTLLLSAILYQEISYRSRTQSIILVLLAPIVGFAINEVRVLTLVFSPYSNLAVVHAAQGMAMLVVGIFLIAGLDSLLSRWIRAAPLQTPTNQERVAPTQICLATIGMACIALSSLVTPSANIVGKLAWNPHDIPLRILEWRSEPLKLDRSYMGSSTFSKEANRRFLRDGDRIDLFAGLNERGRRSSNTLTPKTLTLGPGRVANRVEKFVLDPAAPSATATTLRSHEGLHRVVLWHSNVGSLAQEGFRALLGLDRGPEPRAGMPYVIRLSTPIASIHEIGAADARLREFALALREEISTLTERVRKIHRQSLL